VERQDKDGWLDCWRAMAPGEPSLWDPVGTPLKRGWDFACELWDRTGPDHPKVGIQQLIIGGNEAVVVASNEGTYRGEQLIIPSVDVWKINADHPWKSAIYLTIVGWPASHQRARKLSQRSR
jgi:hypothetical protein